VSLLALSLRSVLRGGRLAYLAVLPLLVALPALVLLATADGVDRTDAFATLTGDLLVPLVVPLVGLVLGVNAFGDERDEHTLGLLLATTPARWRIALAKYAAAGGVTVLVCLPAVLACAALATASRLDTAQAVGALALASLLAAAVYPAVFLLLSLVLRRAVLLGLAYLVLWEGLLATRTVAFRNLSLGSYARRVVAAPFDEAPFAVADVGMAAAVLVLVLLTVVAVLLSTRLLGRTHR
jgi:ABC-2 type transport system permease protein